MTISELVKKLGFKIINEKTISVWPEIAGQEIYRAGLELNGYISSKSPKNIIVWGTKEQNWFNLIGINKSIKSIETILKNRPPAIFLSIGIKGNIKKTIIDLCTKEQIPVIDTNLRISEVFSLLSPSLVEMFSPSLTKHASLVEINGVGVMIMGESGMGKSEVVIELVQLGYNFVSDDTAVLKRTGAKIIGYPSPITKGLLEVRGLGIIDILHSYGERILRDNTEVKLVIELVKLNIQNDNDDRLGIKNHELNILGINIPKITLSVKEGIPIKSLIIAAVDFYLAKKKGYNSLEEVKKRIRSYNNDKKS